MDAELADELEFRITTTPFDENYEPSKGSRITTNFANLARGEQRQQNLRRALTMISCRANDLAHWDNPDGNRYLIKVDIISVQLNFAHGGSVPFPLLEMLDLRIIDRQAGKSYPGIVGNSFSSYVRDYDFSVRLPSLGKSASGPVLPADFGELHGKLFQHFLDSDAYRERFSMLPVICISISTSRSYRRSGNIHPILGIEYLQDESSMTDDYFTKMGLSVRYFMPRGSVAPLAFYFRGDLTNDYSNLQLIATISTMETFQKIYRPEIYNANSAAGLTYSPRLEQQNFSRTQIDYDRDERSRLGVEQGRFTESHFIEPNREVLERWLADYPKHADRAPRMR